MSRTKVVIIVAALSLLAVVVAVQTLGLRTSADGRVGLDQPKTADPTDPVEPRAHDDRPAVEKAESDRIAAEKKAESDRIAAERKAESDRLAAEKRAADAQAAADKHADDPRDPPRDPPRHHRRGKAKKRAAGPRAHAVPKDSQGQGGGVHAGQDDDPDGNDGPGQENATDGGAKAVQTRASDGKLEFTEEQLAAAAAILAARSQAGLPLSSATDGGVVETGGGATGGGATVVESGLASVADGAGSPPAAAGPMTPAAPSAFWHLWWNHRADGPAQPVLRPNTINYLHVRLSSTVNRAPGIEVVPGGADTSNQVQQLISRSSTQSRTLALTAYVVLERRIFEKSAASGTLPIRSTPAEGSGEPTVDGEVAIPIRTRPIAAGTAAIARLAVLIWNDALPVDEVVMTVCVAADADRDSCRERFSTARAPTSFGLERLGLADVSPPDAAMHLIEMPRDGLGRVLRGVFRRKGGPFRVWRVELSVQQLRQELEGPLREALNRAVRQLDDAEIRAQGLTLTELLFPPDDDDAKAARLEFERFAQEHFKHHDEGPEQAPRFLVRMIPYDSQDPVFVPFGLLAVKPGPQQRAEPLGFHFRIELPLVLQSYAGAQECVKNWVLLAPKAGSLSPLEGGGDGPLSKALKAAGFGGADSSFNETQRSLTHYDQIPRFRDDYARKEEIYEPTALLMLAHHDRNALLFEDGTSFLSASFRARFREPSVVILNACGTSVSDFSGFINHFNRQGATAEIATVTEVTGELAGHFLECFGSSLAAAQGGRPISDIYFDSILCLRDHKSGPDLPQADGGLASFKYGSLALVYALLGDGNVRLCPSPPRKT